MVYAKLFFEEFKADCEDLSNEQIGAYLRVRMEIYAAMGPIAFDDRRLARRLNCRPHKARALVLDLVANRKLYLTADGRISDHDAEHQIAEFVRISVQNQFNARSPRNKQVSTAKKLNEINNSGERSLSGRPAISESRKDNLQRSAVSRKPKPPPAQQTMMLPLPGGRDDGPRTSEQSLADLRQRKAGRG
jgi:uncharacterized protein YdaU (DUF1376 family)